MRPACGSATFVGFVFTVCGCSSQIASTPEDAIKKFIENEMLVTAGRNAGVKEGEGETFGEVIQWYEPKPLDADLHVRGRVRGGQLHSETIPKGTQVYRLVFAYNGVPREEEKMNTMGWRLQNPRHASKYQGQDGRCDAVFYVDGNNRVLWVSPADFWDHVEGELIIIREKGLETEPGINETHAF